MSFDYAVNGQITSSEVRLINNNGEQVGVVSLEEALDMADQVGLDLVEINRNSNPPVCKIIDYGKFKYELTRKEKEIAKKSRLSKSEVKEIHLRPNTDKNDISIKARKAKEFLEDGDKVKVSVKFKGREVSYMDIGKSVLDTFLDAVGNYRLDKPVSVADKQLFAIIAPNGKK